MARNITALNRWAIVVSGSRDWTDREAILTRLRLYPPDTLVLHGGAAGADSIAGWTAERKLDMRPVSHRYIQKLGSAGGPVRNSLLIALLSVYRSYGYQCAVEAFKLKGHENRGTTNLCECAERSGFGEVLTVTWGDAP